MRSDTEPRAECTELESLYGGHIRKLRHMLITLLNGATLADRDKAIKLLEEGHNLGDFLHYTASDPVLAIDENTAHQCAGWLRDTAEILRDPTREDGSDDLPAWLDVATIEWCERELRRELLRADESEVMS